MINSIKNIISRRPVFLILLPVFFVFHGYVENWGLVPAGAATQLALEYAGIALLLGGLGWIIFRKSIKAGLFAFVLLCIQFFFGSVQDFLQGVAPGSFFTRYIFLLPLVLLTVVLIVLWLKRTKHNFYRLAMYLTTLLLVLLMVDLVNLVIKKTKSPISVKDESWAPTTHSTYPDVYLIVADSYPGTTELNNLFGYDNSAFINGLRQRGFFVADSSRSNYNFTRFSVASLLNMNYLEGIRGSNSDKNDIAICNNTLLKSNVVRFFTSHGYTFYNNAIFDFHDNNSVARPTFMAGKTKLITSQTLLYRLWRDLGFHLATTLKLGFIVKDLRYFDLRNNTKLYERTLQAAADTTTRKFVYTHLMMPHYPYYFDSAGTAVPYSSLTDEQPFDKKAFLGYLQYANRQYLSLVDSILAKSKKPPLIIIMSDHGFRELRDPVDSAFFFANFNALRLPAGRYQDFYPGVSLVNQFRIILNTEFEQRLPLLPDSTHFIRE